ncbi:MAG: 2-C-methyl-D-erythritol 4-phosphate cytidylyltransferase [Xanthomonadaceae bacterium]|nr:2-C-methyl-D-erythritol 4-phosphate cytidylyltransferase [Xanthomonadaceae bacterium]MDE1886180.1 2-C-methyl-D-erythritol 4-phosphate cytidylyltransferase [Xanthomonadaceae bacterium]MDE1960160.1 2-C-methyl-D-erythritol 4-phosphate cytidylyltransferase [Xanthomonadaceae bacterium]MDE2084178.1 2-C-methyl-D-erythritol 4-phosphate cytidylyltransferase [Xanthomonadaceae bacterium]MDE2258645.1 2-C-methyl-D-erythritol 4-phosphate cytidylyltransferase [Xanthomonadaceae bacterium]
MATADALWCVVPAAGRGVRVGSDVPKQYLPIAGKPMLLHTLERLAAHPRIAGLMVVLEAGDARWPKWLTFDAKPVSTAIGGAGRSDSVLSGLRALSDKVEEFQFVLVHDAARPCVRAADISNLIERGIPAGGALLAAPVRDTLKRADVLGRVAATEPREARWRALTPQLFRCGELVGALESARAAGIAVTDEAMAMERMGHKPLLVEGSEDNIKVTTPADFALAQFLLARMD